MTPDQYLKEHMDYQTNLRLYRNLVDAGQSPEDARAEVWGEE